MSNPFIIPVLAAMDADLAGRHFPLARGAELQRRFAEVFSRHLGRLRTGRHFEAHSLLVTGHSGSGKTAEISELLERFNASRAELPDGKRARFARCVLEAQGSWKDLGRKTLHALGYPISGKSRRTQSEIWDLVGVQAKLQGVVGIHFDEAQHILRGKGEKEVLGVLDAFKTLMKSHDWPLMLILSGVPELGEYVQREPQLDRLMTRITFDGIALDTPGNEAAEGYRVLNEIVGSYALNADLRVDDELRTGRFLHRLATAGAFRWGLVIDLVVEAATISAARGEGSLGIRDFVTAWCRKTGDNQKATPFTHEAYERMFPREQPFRGKAPL